MLIASERHRPEDLRLWAEYEQADIARAASSQFERKYQDATDRLALFADAGPCYCSVSWGKDSVVLAHLASCYNSRLNCQRPIPFAWVTVGELDVGCRAVRDAFLSLWPNPYREIEVDAGERTDKGTKGKRVGFRAAEAELGERRLIGIRADESGTRTISARMWGAESVHACRPLLWWTADDVFAALARFGLPVHPNYAMLGGGRWERSRLRTAPLAGKRGDNYGRAEWESEYWGDVIRRNESRKNSAASVTNPPLATE